MPTTSQPGPTLLPFRRDVPRPPRGRTSPPWPSRANPNRPPVEDWQRFGKWSIDGSPVAIDFQLHKGAPPSGADVRWHEASGQWVSIRLVNA